MPDTSFQLLLPYLHNTRGPTLLVADENLLSSIANLNKRKDITVLSNRHDVMQACQDNEVTAQFSDFDFTPWQGQPQDTIVYRVSKERPVVHHVINQAFLHLKTGGRLILSGEKNDGIKNTVKAAAKLFGSHVTATKTANSYHAEIPKVSDQPSTAWLDDKTYNDIREIGQLQGMPVFSKPGTFGWNKFDKGSEYLIALAAQYLQNQSLEDISVLDLGCGYGYLSLQTANWRFIGSRHATDNNAAALLCLTKNAEAWGLAIKVTPDDCGSHINQTFDLILCNPPFHQGFETDSTLTDKFIKQTRRMLKPDGEALFVVNQFIPLEKLARNHFSHIEVLGNNGSFKVVSLRKSPYE